jgi:cell division protein FtsN
MPINRKSGSNRRSARRNGSGGIPAWFWFIGGILIGLGVAVMLMIKGYVPEIRQHLPAVDDNSADTSEAAAAGEEIAEPKKPRYDFFTVLPEMEVVVPEQELSRKADTPDPLTDTPANSAPDNYILQAGSFRNASDAEQLKAQLALLGSIATVQKVTVDDETWYRVRIGPFADARAANEMRRTLADNQIETLVMKANP